MAKLLRRIMQRSNMRSSEATALIWAVLGAAVCGVMIQLEPNLLEEGLIVHVAQRMAAGEHLYRDVASFTGPLPFELLAALFRVFGEEIVVARCAVVALHGVACASVYAVALRAGAGPLAHAAAAGTASAPVLLFPLFSLFFHTTLAFDLSLIAAWPAVRATRSAGWAGVAGAVVAGAALCKQTVGVALAASLLAAVAAVAPPGRRLRVALAFAAGGAAVAALTLGVYAVRGDLGILVRSLVLLPLSFDETFATPYMNFWPPGEFAPDVRPDREFYLPSLWSVVHPSIEAPTRAVTWITQLLYASPFVALAATALRRARGTLSAAAWVHTAVLVALVTNLFPRTDWGHLVFVLPPTLTQLLLVAPGARSGERPGRALAAAATAVVLALCAGNALAARSIFGRAGPATLGPRVPQHPVTRQLRSREPARVIDFLRRNTEPGEAIFVARGEPLLYFATDTRNPTPYSGVLPGMRADQERAILAALDEVRYVVMSDIDQPLYTYYRDELPAVQHALERHFRFVPLGRMPGWISLLERGPDRGPALLDLFDTRDQGRAWIRDGDGRQRPAPGPVPRLATRMNRRPLGVWLGPRGGGIDFAVEVPEGAVFQADVGLSELEGEDDPRRHAERSRLAVSVATRDR
ncbi:MAG: hypothetical protein OEM05_13825, partial [Myxococcales bacterium]|nr:hypothetical protein [Myxococcales bacterium]